ncbi:MAG: MoxR family ATPase [Acidobacteria bacterium]|nr:MoxR family ATPase [Acidobacteriota bacterium]MXZ60723.1 MoxR family ATPase [Acidobacteriota bacterium]MYA47580.1 MoxR family ATPase [Acidobacteriota bacterium]MYF14983.1 MoxR family ATPase [Acidobacteriota bacterium]MYI39698.1 MoxR family ATPase [Acidobacteriota bacterium]
MREAAERITGEIRKRIIGQEQAVEEVLISLFVGGNSIITGVPGLAKTMIVQTLSEVLALRFQRIQFTPDLMPSDITGTDIIQENPETGKRNLVFVPGPVFANIVLADEINRTPPKTQSALLEAMQEHQVTVQGRTYPLPEPYFVFATQNPIELEGTYPLPEAQLDRFLFNIIIDYLPVDQEREVVRATTSDLDPELDNVLSGEELLDFQRLVRRVPVSEPVLAYAVELARRSRPGEEGAPDFVNEQVQYGASVRAAQFSVLGGKARALMHGRHHVAIEDVQALAPPIFRHRVLPNFQAQSEKVDSEAIVRRLIEEVPVPASRM